MHINRRLFTATLAALFSAGLLVSCGSDNNSSSSTITQVVSFGDSLSDIGTYGPVKVMSTGVKFSTNPAPLWTEVVASAYGLPLKPNAFVRFNKDVGTDGDFSFNAIQSLTGLSYAQGSARVSSMPISTVYALNSANIYANAPSSTPLIPASSTAAGATDVIVGYSFNGSGVPYAAKSGTPTALTAVSVKDQISNYLNTHGNTFSGNQLVLIQGGANDLFVALSTFQATGNMNPDSSYCGGVALSTVLVAGPDTIVTCAAKEMAVQLKRLVDAGATNILYANLPDVGNTPQFYGGAFQSTVSGLSTAYNATVTASMAALGITNAIDVYDLAGFFTSTLTSPPTGTVADPVTKIACLDSNGSNSVANVTSLGCASAANGGNGLIVADAATTYFFADGVHPTQLGHRLWGEAAATAALASFP